YRAALHGRGAGPSPASRRAGQHERRPPGATRVAARVTSVAGHRTVGSTRPTVVTGRVGSRARGVGSTESPARLEVFQARLYRGRSPAGACGRDLRGGALPLVGHSRIQRGIQTSATSSTAMSFFSS